MKLPLFLAASLALVACAAPTEPTAVSEAAMPAPSSQRQFFSFVPRAVLDAKVAVFRERNEGEWTLNEEGANEMLTPTLGPHLWRRVPSAAPDVRLDRAAEIARVRAFVAKNADLLGIDVPADSRVVPRSGAAYSVESERPLTLGVTTGYRYFVEIGRDGEVVSVSAFGRRFPALALDPSNDFDRDLVARRVVGSELTLHGEPFASVLASDLAGPSWGHVYARETVGPDGVTLTRVVNVTIDLAREADPCSIPFTSWYLTVDAGTGEVLDGTDTQCLMW